MSLSGVAHSRDPRRVGLGASLSTVELHIVWVLALALGSEPRELEEPDWRRVFAIARSERCAVLAWLRGGSVIRRRCPATLVEAWRSFVLAMHHASHEHLALTAECANLLGRRGVTPIVLKGVALSLRLYGDQGIRPVDDVDLFVRHEERRAAREALESVGWRINDGRAPEDERYVRRAGSSTQLVDLHSHLVSNALAHLPSLPAKTTAANIASVELPVLSDDVMPAYLAAHLAQHKLAPMLWFLDFAALWSSLDHDTRVRATAIARDASLAGCLRWAIERTSALPRAAEGDLAALRAFGVGRSRRRDVHVFLRLLALSDTPSAVGDLLGYWVLPRTVRSHPLEAVRLYGQRSRKSLREIFVHTRTYDAC